MHTNILYIYKCIIHEFLIDAHHSTTACGGGVFLFILIISDLFDILGAYSSAKEGQTFWTSGRGFICMELGRGYGQGCVMLCHAWSILPRCVLRMCILMYFIMNEVGKLMKVDER